MIHVKSNRVAYLLTPTGIAEKAKMSRDSLRYSLRFYSEARQRVNSRFAELSMSWPPDSEKRIVFFGTGEVAEIGYICLQDTDLHLVGAIDDQGRGRFFDVPVHSPEWLRSPGNSEAKFARLVVMSLEDVQRISRKLNDLGVHEDRISWL